MAAILMVVLSGLVGGIGFAVLFSRIKRSRSGPDASDVFGASAPTDIINMAHIRVAGVGGLGLVVVALATALDVPQIGQSVGLGLALAIPFAVALILWRRRGGPMPSSGGQSGANTMLAIDAADAREDDPRTPPSLIQAVLVIPSTVSRT
jgi:hypothetical protein